MNPEPKMPDNLPPLPNDFHTPTSNVSEYGNLLCICGNVWSACLASMEAEEAVKDSPASRESLFGTNHLLRRRVANAEHPLHMKTDLLDLRNMDCMDLMAEFPDKHFDLAIVDPPYGIDAAADKRGGKKHGKAAVSSRSYGAKTWDKSAPDAAYFKEISRVSKNQIIWGANHFGMPPSPSWVVWDKINGDNGYADCELAWTSFQTAVRQFRFQWAGMLQGDMANKESRIHPTQKPVALYKWLLQNYAKPGQRVLDTHLGSGSHAIACHYFGAHLTASELDPDYFKAACERIDRETRQADMFSQSPALLHHQPELI